MVNRKIVASSKYPVVLAVSTLRDTLYLIASNLLFRATFRNGTIASTTRDIKGTIVDCLISFGRLK